MICADGTWNVLDQVDKATGKRRPTNVTKLARAVRPTDTLGVTQVVFYGEGVGTRGGVDKLTGGAFGHGVEDNIVSLYRCIIYNYEPGDELFLFGFSRGAFTARSLAGFMHFAGLLEKDDDYFTPEIYACYEAGQGPGTAKWSQANRKVKGTRPSPPIRMIGVWDTVGALGAPGVLGQVFSRNKYVYHDVGLNPMIHHAFHALALDERRKPFAPTLWSAPEGWSGHLEQAWFAGVHCNVGGGYSPDGLANEALHWIAGEAAHLGLELDFDYLRPFEPHFDSTLHDSMSLKYRALGTFERHVGLREDARESVHESVLKRLASQTAKYSSATASDYFKRSDHAAARSRRLA
ncbi:MAG: DUF2235 domain-containing protein [Pseudomarimonas sp.]